MAATTATTDEESARTLPPPMARRSFWSLTRTGFGVALFLLLLGLVSLWYFSDAEDHFVDADAKRVQYREKVYSDRVTEDQKYLNDQPSWFAKDKGLVRVPIQTAIEMTIPRLQAVKPHPAYPLTQSPPQPAAAPVFSAEAAKIPAGNGAGNPPASNPTVGQPSPAAVAPAPTAAPATSASSPAPGSPAKATAIPTVAPTPATTGAPAPAQGASGAPAPASTPTPAPAATPASGVKEVPSNNANNPGNGPIPGTSVQTPAPVPAEAAPAATPTSGSKPEPRTSPEAQPSPVGNNASAGSTPTPAPNEPGATPGGTPR